MAGVEHAAGSEALQVRSVPLPPHQLTPSAPQKIQYWVKHLEGLPALQLPTDYPRPVPIKYVEAEDILRLSKATSKLLLKLRYECNPPLYLKKTNRHTRPPCFV